MADSQFITRRFFMRNTAAVSAAAAIAAPVVAEAASPLEPLVWPEDRFDMWAKPLSGRDLAIWHMRELERLAKEDGATEAMVTIVGRFHDPDFHCKTLMLSHHGVIDDFGKAEFLTGLTI